MEKKTPKLTIIQGGKKESISTLPIDIILSMITIILIILIQFEAV